MIQHRSQARMRGWLHLSLGALMLAGVLAGIGIVAARPSPVLAGTGGCSLLVRGGSSPPAAHIDLYAGQSAGFSGTFIPDAEVVFVSFKDGFQHGTAETFMADADGSIDSIGLFIQFWGTDAGHWTFEASVPDTECAGTASATVTGTVVSIATFICDEDIQSAEDLAAADPNDVCDSLVLPGDEASVPPAHTDNQATANFNWELHEATAQERHLDAATRAGGGTCDPVAMHCTFALTYEWVGAVGHSSMTAHPPAGYRFGTARWFGPDASAFTVLFSGRRLSFNVIGGAEEPHSVHVYYFSLGTTGTTPSPTPTVTPATPTVTPATPAATPATPAANQLPDTASRASGDLGSTGSPTGATTVFLVAALAASVGALIGMKGKSPRGRGQ